MPLKTQSIWTAVFIGLVIGVIGLTLWFNLWLNKEVVLTQRQVPPVTQPKGLEPASEPLVDLATVSSQQPQSLPALEPVGQSREVQAEPVQEEPVQARPVKEEPVEAEPVQAEPVKEEVVKEEPIKQEPPAMVVVGSSQGQSVSGEENNAPADGSSSGVTEASKRPSQDQMKDMLSRDIALN